MPSSTSLLDADEGESEVPLLHAFTGMGLEEPRGAHDRSPGEPNESLSFPHHSHQLTPVSHYSLLGTVLDLKPLSRPSSADGVINTGSPVDAEPEVGDLGAVDGGGLLLAPVHRRPPQPSGPLRSGIPTGLEPPHVDAMLLFSGDERDELPVGSGLPSANGMALLPASVYGDPGYETESSLLARRKSVNTTECVAVPSSEHVAEIVGRQGCKIKALRGKTNTYIKTPVRGEQPVFVVTGRKEDVAMAKREILSAAEHFSLIRASRNKTGPLSAVSGAGAPVLPGQTTIQVRVPYRVVGLVVGPKGATIKRIQQQTHTYIVTPSRDKEPVFEVTGMPENVDRAREEIEAHIALRTGSCGGIEAPGADNNDFQFNGTDVSFEHASRPGGGVAEAAWLHSAASSPGGTSLLPMSANSAQRLNSNSNGGSSGGAKMSSSYRNDSSSSLGSGSSSTDSFYGGNGNQGSDYSPTCLFNANINNNNNNSSSHGNSSGFWFGDTLLPVGSEELLTLGAGVPPPPSGFDPLTISTAQAPPTHIWSPYADNQPPHTVEGHHSQNSHPGTPRLSPTFPLPEALEHPQARRVHRASSAMGSLGTGGGAMDVLDPHRFPSFSSAFSSSSDSTASSSSPPDSSLCLRPGGVGRGGEVCIQCMDQQVTAALVPCGHHMFCLDCATHICQAADAVCPVCVSPATQAIQLRNM